MNEISKIEEDSTAPTIVTLEDFQSVDFLKPISENQYANCHRLQESYRPVIEAADIVDKFRSELEQIFTAPVVNEIDLLFVHRPGPALRHEFAHGKIASGYCYHPDIIYACWLIYRLCCLPLMPHWKEHIASLIEAECF